MVYAVGPDCGNKQKQGRYDTGDLSLAQFLSGLRTTGGSITSAVEQYNVVAKRGVAARTGPPTKLPTIEVLRISLLSGGAYKHPRASKVEVLLP